MTIAGVLNCTENGESTFGGLSSEIDCGVECQGPEDVGDAVRKM